MIITMICDVLGEENNGTTIAAMNLIRHLRKCGHTVRIVCPDQQRKGEENYYVVPTMNFGKVLNKYVAKAGVVIAKTDKKILEEAIEGADLVHIMIPLGLGLTAIKIAKQKNLPVTAGFHMQAEILTGYLKLDKLKFLNKVVYKYIYKHLYKYVNAIHYPTKFIQDVFESNVKHQTNGYVISNGVHSYVQKKDVEKPQELKDKIVILSTGRYSKEKSQDTLIKALKYSKYEKDIQLIFAGQGVKEKYYKKLSKNLTNAPIFKLYPRTELVDVINYCDLYVHPAVNEIEGIACIEAVVCGKLTIATDSKLSATRNFVVDEKCLFKSKNAKDLARVIDFWIENPELKKKYEQLQLDNAVNFNQDECMKQMEAMLIEVASEKK